MQAGKMDRRVTILRDQGSSTNGFGEPVANLAELATVWACKTNVSDGERFRAGEQAADLQMRFTLRWSSQVADVDPRDRLLFEGRTYDIAAVKELGRRRGLEITAAARAETPAG